LQVIDEYGEFVHLVEIDIEEDPEIAEAAGIMGTPCVQFFKNKEMLRFVICTSISLVSSVVIRFFMFVPIFSLLGNGIHFFKRILNELANQRHILAKYWTSWCMCILSFLAKHYLMFSNKILLNKGMQLNS
jgi:hypothetical protein